jgi:hypothetical protein
MDTQKRGTIGLWFMPILIVAVVTEASLAAFLPLAFPTGERFYLWNPDLAQVRRAWTADVGDRMTRSAGHTHRRRLEGHSGPATGSIASPVRPTVSRACRYPADHATLGVDSLGRTVIPGPFDCVLAKY